MTTTQTTTTIPTKICDPEFYGDMSSSNGVTHLVVKDAGRARKTWAVYYCGPDFPTLKYPGWTSQPRSASCEAVGQMLSCRANEMPPEVEVQQGDLLEICGDIFLVIVGKNNVPQLERLYPCAKPVTA